MSHPPKRSRIRLYALIGGVAFFFCCICPLVYGLTTGTMRSIGLLPTLTYTPTHTSTPSPTDTPLPTNTPVPPTNTPQPTPTPVPPTDTPEPVPKGPPPEVAAYMLEMMPKIQAISESLKSFSELMSEPKIGDENWTVAVALHIVTIQTAHKELTEMEVPPEMEEIHEAVLDATGDCNESMDYVVTGIDNMDAEDLETAASLMNSCGEKTQKATKMMEEYAAQFK